MYAMIAYNPLFFFQMKQLISLPSINPTMPPSVHPDHAYSSTTSRHSTTMEERSGVGLPGSVPWLHP